MPAGTLQERGASKQRVHLRCTAGRQPTRMLIGGQPVVKGVGDSGVPVMVTSRRACIPCGRQPRR
jgi:hypothetical protein